jgi:hypothetical protein
LIARSNIRHVAASEAFNKNTVVIMLFLHTSLSLDTIQHEKAVNKEEDDFFK